MIVAVLEAVAETAPECLLQVLSDYAEKMFMLGQRGDGILEPMCGPM